MQLIWRRACKPVNVLVGIALLGAGILLGCDDNTTESDDVFSDAQQRVEESYLPEITDESEDVLRNLLNLLTAFPEVCSTRLADLGSFTSSLPALSPQQQVGPTLDDEEATWEVTWQDVVLGDDDPPLTVDTETPSVDITLTIHYLSRGQAMLRAVPFSLTPRTGLQTAGEPASFAAGTTEGFFLFQDATSGNWTLRWRALEESKVFEGSIDATALSRVIRRVAEGAGNAVTSLEVNDAATEIRFSETTAPMDDKGFTFFVRPGETVSFELRIGADEDSLQSITREQLRIGADDQLLPPDEDPDDFMLVSNLPTDAGGAPTIAPGAEVGTFVWQDIDNNDCDAATEDQWRLRFGTQGGTIRFSGTVDGVEDDDGDVRLRASAVGGCPAGDIDNDRELTYDCPLQDDMPSGYDICVSRGGRVTFSPEVNEVRHPGFVFVGAERDAPPSPDPFTIRFEIELTELQSSRELEIDDTNVFLGGNNDDDAESDRLNPEQVSLDPLCSIPSEQVQPRVRLLGSGNYSTDRFDGSDFFLGEDDDVQADQEGIEFRTANVDSLTGVEPFPDRGMVLLETRLEGETEDTNITAPMNEIVENSAGSVIVPVDVELSVSRIIFDFPNQVITLTVE